LSLREGRLSRLSEETDHSVIGMRVVAMLDRLNNDLRDEGKRPPPSPEDGPPTREI